MHGMTAAHIHILWGTDDLAISRRIETWTSKYDETAAGFNVARFDARQPLDEAALNNAVSSLPFLASERLVILFAPSKRWTGLDGHKKFLAWLETVPPTTRLVIVEPEEIKKKDQDSHWLLKWAAKSKGRALAEGHLQPDAKKMAEWIQAETRRQGGRIEPAAAARLAELVGENARQATQEIAKLLTYVNDPQRAISLEDVEHVSVFTAAGDIFALVDALAEGKGREAQAMLARLLRQEDAGRLFAMIVRQFRLLLQARELLNGGTNERGVQSALAVHEFVAKKITGQARKFDLPTLEAIYRRLVQVDEAWKTGQMQLEVALDLLVVELAPRPAG